MKDTTTYTVVKTDDWQGDLQDHPSIVDHPEIFEIADCDIPEMHQYLEYVRQNDINVQ